MAKEPGTWRRGAVPPPTAVFFDDLEDVEREADRYEELPEVVRQFLVYFRAKFRESNAGVIPEIHRLYEDSFSKLSERYFKSAPWPEPAVVAEHVEHDELFLIFYKELYYRHLYANMQPTLAQRIEAWDNYCGLFTAFLEDRMLGVELPPSWLWDATDEFVYQFEAWAQYRARLKTKDPEDIAYLQDNDQIWNVNTVLQYLHALVNKSNICPWLLNDNEPIGSDDPEDEDFDLSSVSVYRYIGYFSVIGLLRIHCLLGDYRLALMVLQPIDFETPKPLYTEVTACHIAVHYYMGFAYLMLRRYEDAVRVFSSTLLRIGRIKQYHTRSYQYEQINKRNDQMLALLAICIAFCPQHAGDSTNSLLNDKYSDRLYKMKHGDEHTFEELFTYAAPKFISPGPPNYEVIADYNLEASHLQIKLFMNEVRQQLILPEVRSYLKLYMSVDMSKMASFMDAEKDTFGAHVRCLKHKSWSVRGQAGAPPLAGTMRSNSDVAVYIDKDVLYIADTKVESLYGEYFIDGVEKLQSITTAIHNKDFVSIGATFGRGSGRGRGRGRGGSRGRGGGRGGYRGDSRNYQTAI